MTLKRVSTSDALNIRHPDEKYPVLESTVSAGTEDGSSTR
jgi:hypothetical protein